MPPIVIAVAAAVASYGAAAGAVALGLVEAGSIAATLIGSLAGMLVATGLSLAFAPAKPTAQGQADSRLQTFVSGVGPRQVVYGQAMVTGPLVYASSFGAVNEWLHLVVPVAGHAVQGYDAIWVNDFRIPLSAALSANGDGTTGAGVGGIAGLYSLADVRIPNGSPAGTIDPANVYLFPASFGGVAPGSGDAEVLLYLYDGTQTAADASLIADIPAEWTSAHKLLGIAYIHAKIYLAAGVFPGGVQTLSAELRGKVDVLDIRTAARGYSNNAALCVLDYLQYAKGLAVPAAEIETAFWISAANICDEAVPTNLSGSTTQKRYTLDGSFKLDGAPSNIMEQLLTSCGGTLVWVAGLYRLFVGAYDAPTVTIGASDFAGGISVVTDHPRSEQFNTIKGTYIEPLQHFAAIAFPQVQSAAALTADGEEVDVTVDFPFTNDATRVQRIAAMRLLVSRVAGLRFDATFKYGMLRMAVWDTAAVTLPDFGWSGQVFRCTKWTFDAVTGLVTASMQAEDSAAYTWLYSQAAPPILSPTTGLVSFISMPAMAAPTVSPMLVGSISFINVGWVAPASPLALGVEMQWKKRNLDTVDFMPWFGSTPIGAGDDLTWNSVVIALPTLVAQIVPAVTGMLYDVRVRAVDGPVTGPWSSTVTVTAL